MRTGRKDNNIISLTNSVKVQFNDKKKSTVYETNCAS